MGGWIYVALTALGPCFATPEVYAPIRDEIPNAAALQARLGRNHELVVASREIQPPLVLADRWEPVPSETVEPQAGSSAA